MGNFQNVYEVHVISLLNICKVPKKFRVICAGTVALLDISTYLFTNTNGNNRQDMFSLLDWISMSSVQTDIVT